jgi:hypothetical protein
MILNKIWNIQKTHKLDIFGIKYSKLSTKQTGSLGCDDFGV